MLGRIAFDITPEEFELEVKVLIEAAGYELLNFTAKHRESVSGSDGDYEIDVLAEFEALGANFTVLVECKRYSNRIKREVVELLHSRVQSVGAQKGMIFATAEFQRGAMEFAEKHGIALITVIEGNSTYVTKSLGPTPDPPSWLNLPKYAGVMVKPSGANRAMFTSVSRDGAEYFRAEMESGVNRF